MGKEGVGKVRDAFFNSLCQIASHDKRVILLAADNGAIVLDKFRRNMPEQFINVGIAEQNMIGVATGLAMKGKIVYVYAIIPFAVMRCFEQIRVDVCWNNLPIKIVGIGAGMTYFTLGPTHHGTEDIALMRSLPEMMVLNPSDNTMASAFARLSYKYEGAVYIRLDRTGEPLVYTDKDSFSDGLSVLRTGRDLWLIATGRMVATAKKVARELLKHSIDTGIIDLYRIKPLNVELLLKAIGDTRYVATLEENSVIAGIGSAISEVLAESGQGFHLKRIGLPDKFCEQYGTREHLLALYNLDVKGVSDTLLKWRGE